MYFLFNDALNTFYFTAVQHQMWLRTNGLSLHGLLFPARYLLHVSFHRQGISWLAGYINGWLYGYKDEQMDGCMDM